MSLVLNLPINTVSFGQASIAILREFHKKGENPLLFPIGQPDVSSQRINEGFGQWINNSIAKSHSSHNRKDPIFKLWHIESSLESFSEKQALMTFYELDSPTDLELNILRNNSRVIVTNEYTKNIFSDSGIDNISVIPLGFDKENFHVKNKKYFSDDRIVFNVVGKAEKRKHHEKVIKAWIRKYGNNHSYFLQCAIYNPFLSPEENESTVKTMLGGKSYFNVQFLGFMQQNELYNDFLNSGSIVIGMSGGEGVGLPEMHSVALGKYGIIMNAHGYKSWATKENSILVNPTGKMEAYDGRFFVKGRPTNQGNIFNFDEEEFLNCCDVAINKYKADPVNKPGLEIQSSHSYEKTAQSILDCMKTL